MAGLIRNAQTTLGRFSSCSPKLIDNGIQLRKAMPASVFQSRLYASESVPTSPLTANIIRILRTEIEYHSESAPPLKPPTKFNSYTVEDRPGEQFITMRGKFGDSEDIKIEATMFDGYEIVPTTEDDSSGEDLRPLITVFVDISKGGGSNDLEFLCSAWPGRLEVHKVYVLHRDRMPAKPYMGPAFRDLNKEMQTRLGDYLEARGVTDELSIFLHQYMMNKDRIELIQWLGKVKSAVER